MMAGFFDRVCPPAVFEVSARGRVLGNIRAYQQVICECRPAMWSGYRCKRLHCERFRLEMSYEVSCIESTHRVAYQIYLTAWKSFDNLLADSLCSRFYVCPR